MPRQLWFTLWSVVLLARSPIGVGKHTHTQTHKVKSPNSTGTAPAQTEAELFCFHSDLAAHSWLQQKYTQADIHLLTHTHTNPKWRQRLTHTCTPLKWTHQYMDTGTHKRGERYGGGRAGSETEGRRRRGEIWVGWKEQSERQISKMQNREAKDVWVGLKHIHFIPASETNWPYKLM